MRLEATTPSRREQIKQILEAKHGIIFYPKAVDHTIPEPNAAYVISIVGNDNLMRVRDALLYFQWYAVNCSAVGDGFGADHIARRVWRAEMIKEFGQDFKEIYMDNNQLRVNNMDFGRPISILTQIALACGDLDRYKKLSAIGAQMWSKVTGRDPNTYEKVGKNYAEMESMDEKLNVVAFNITKCKEVLGLYSQTVD